MADKGFLQKKRGPLSIRALFYVYNVGKAQNLAGVYPTFSPFIFLKMKKQHFAFVLMLQLNSLLAPHILQAQTIPDANFAQAIRNVCPTCINASNVLLAPAATLTTLDVSGEMVSDLTGLNGFTSLQRFECISNLITILPALPSTLTYLDCTNNQISSLPMLPNTLTTLNCSANRFGSLPTPLPSALRVLNCSSNPFTVLPALPNSLLDLQCYGGQFTSLPTLPSGLQTLNCGDGKITTLPTLPNTLTTLFCYNNQLTVLPTLPASLTWLSCSNNSLPNLPTLPTGMKKLYCALNPLMTLQPLPTTLTHLDCHGNQLTRLPSLPTTLKILYCYENQITSLPMLPNSLTDLIIDATIACIPNQVVGLTIYDKDYRILTRPTCPTIGIELLFFKGIPQYNGHLLTWATASEINTSHYDIQRSADGQRFTTIGEQKAANKAATYQFTDPSPLSITYYRLAIREFDGTTTFSKVISVRLPTPTQQLKAYPSVTTGFLTIETTEVGIYKERTAYSVVNMLGQVVLTGKSDGQIDVSALVAETYFLKIGEGQAKFVKQ